MILVTGDVVLDHNTYTGQRFTTSSRETVGMMNLCSLGGARLTYGLLAAMAENTSKAGKGCSVSLAFGLDRMEESDLSNWPAAFHAGAVWDAATVPGKKQLHWRLSKNLGYGAPGYTDYPATPLPGLELHTPRVLVIDDGGLGFRLKSAERCWPPILTSKDPALSTNWIVLKMAPPLARGDLWRTLAGPAWKDRLIVIVSADDLRREDVRVSKGLSWEGTADDLVDEVRSNPALRGLRSCRHLLVSLRGDAALWFDAPDRSPAQACRLVFDRERSEGEWEDLHQNGTAYGFLSAITAALAWHLERNEPGHPPDLVPALKAGLSATRFLREFGHGPLKAKIKVKDQNGIETEIESVRTPRFPFTEAADHLLKPTTRYAVAEVRCLSCDSQHPGQLPNGGQWTILRQTAHSEAFPGPLFGPARRVALLGPEALQDVPCARFGKLLTMDRREIEALRSLRQLMVAYKDSGPQKQPLSLAVFGAPGSGKSFGLKQIAEGVFGQSNPVLEFNLSQFKGPEDLIGAYHQVRDQVLAGKTPIVFWDEFDSGKYRWLQYLLAPMQDGAFQEGQLTHAIGKSVFVFAGGTSRDFAHFGPSDDPDIDESEPEKQFRQDFVMAKGPDFKSRLAGFLDVLGPNPRQLYDREAARKGSSPWVDDPEDLDFPVRRAILLRSMLGFVKDKENDPLAIDRGLLTAFLEIGHYRNGARSLEKLVSQMKDRGGVPLRRAHLPPDSLLALYVDDVPHFRQLICSSHAFLQQAEGLAASVHQDWLDSLTAEEKGGHYDVPYAELDQEGKDANIAAAMRIPETLSLAGFLLEPGEATQEEELATAAFLTQNLEILAEAEHDGWADQRRMEGWTYAAEKDSDKRTHPLLVPYAELCERQKDKDRRTIKNYPRYARNAGFRIVSKRSR